MTATGVGLLAAVPLPRSPPSLPPQQSIALVVSAEHAWKQPVLIAVALVTPVTATGVGPSAVVRDP